MKNSKISKTSLLSRLSPLWEHRRAHPPGREAGDGERGDPWPRLQHLSYSFSCSCVIYFKRIISSLVGRHETSCGWNCAWNTRDIFLCER